MYDDITLDNVKHILDLKKNLISLDTLDANACKFTTEGGIMKIMRGSFILMIEL